MTVESIMTSRLHTVGADEPVSKALLMMREHQIRNLPVVDDNGRFVGLFGIRRLARLLLPKAATELKRHSLTDLDFLPDELGQMYERLREAGNRPVSEFLEKRSRLIFCTPDTTYPKLLKLLLNQSTDSSLPVIVVAGEKRQLVGMVSLWDITNRLIREVFATQDSA
jgi:acetoin utilization protein AcuB